MINRNKESRNQSQEQWNKPANLPGRGIRQSLIWFLIIFTLLPWLWGLFADDDNATRIDYSSFRQQLQAGNVARVTVSGDTIEGTLKEPAIQEPVEPAPTQPAGEEAEPTESQDEQYTEFVTYVPSFGDEGLLPLLEAQNVAIETKPVSDFSWLALLLNVFPFLLLIGIGYMFFSQMRSQGQGIFSVGKSRAKLYDRTKERTLFSDVAGAHAAKVELMEIVDYLKDPSRLTRLGGEAPKGILLVGPPGTGKTLLARAIAGEADVPFFSITGSDFMEMFVGVGASRVRDLFREAKQVAPSIIFIDELDSIGRRRGAGLGGGHDEREQTLNQLLSELDGFESNQSVIVLAATNRPDILDPALLRPGRFDRQVTIDLPTLRDRVEILKLHSRDKPLAGDISLERLARGTPGFSGADLENILNEAALIAARKDKTFIGQDDIEEARDKVLMGLKRENLVLTDEECQLIAYHEAGHALVAAILPNADPVHKVTIVPRGRAMGVTQQLPEREKYVYPREYLLDRLAVMMGGRAAEQLKFQTATSGAENDLKQATQLARKMVLDWGMSNLLQHVALGSERKEVFLGEEIGHHREYSETTAREVDQEVKGILEEAYQRAARTLQEHRRQLDDLAELLLEKEEVSGEAVLELIGVSPEEKAPLLSDNGRTVT